MAGAALSGLGNYLFQVQGTRGLGEEAFAPISVLWTIWYLLLTVILFSVEAYITRAVAAQPEGHRVRGPAIVLAAWIAVTAAVLGGATWLLREALFGGLGALAAVVGALVVTYGIFALVRGVLAGSGAFRTYGVVTALESLAKVALAVPVLLVLGTPASFAWLMPAGPAVAVVWWLLRRGGGAATAARSDGASDGAEELDGIDRANTGPGRFLLLTTVSNSAAQILLAAGPLALVALGAGPVEVSVFFVTITAARVPIVFAYGGLLSRILPPLTRLVRAGEAARLRRIALLCSAGALSLGLVGAVAGALIGPPVIGALFGGGFTPPAWFAAAAAFGVLTASGAMLLGQLLIAADAEHRLIAPWMLGLAVAGVVIAVLTGTPSERVAAGFVAGELAALAGLLLEALRTSAGVVREPEEAVV
jgi:O-antigen/teichoic acid export membrane protein